MVSDEVSEENFHGLYQAYAHNHRIIYELIDFSTQFANVQ